MDPVSGSLPDKPARGQARVFGATVIINEDDVHLLSDEQKSFLVETKRSDGLIYFKAEAEAASDGIATFVSAAVAGAVQTFVSAAVAGSADDLQNSARREYEEDLANAWKEDPEFVNAFDEAFVLGDIKPLLQYLCSDKPLTRLSRRRLAGYIRWLVEQTRKRGKGRPRRNAAKAPPVERAERNAAWLVRFNQEGWCKEHGRERVPAKVTDEWIREASEVAAREFNVPVDKILPRNVRNQLKTGRTKLSPRRVASAGQQTS